MPATQASAVHSMNQLSDPEEEFVVLSERELERLHGVMHASLGVRRRTHFYLWVQGQVQSLIPHEVLLCAHGDPARSSLAFERFSSTPLPESDADLLVNPESGFAAQAVRAWTERGSRPLFVAPDARDDALYRRFETALFRHRFENFAVHGTPPVAGLAGTYFVFARLTPVSAARLLYALDLLLPQLHMTYARVVGSEQQEQPAVPSAERLITAREIEILQWVRDGKSNQEIGDILAISPLTVKNHVQKILRKLNVQNRAQAVARGLALQVIRNSA